MMTGNSHYILNDQGKRETTAPSNTNFITFSFVGILWFNFILGLNFISFVSGYGSV